MHCYLVAELIRDPMIGYNDDYMALFIAFASFYELVTESLFASVILLGTINVI